MWEVLNQIEIIASVIASSNYIFITSTIFYSIKNNILILTNYF